LATLVLDEIEVPSTLSFLLLEDEEHYQKCMLTFLKELGLVGEIHQSYTVEDAIKQVELKKFDVVFSDWNLPDGKGVQFLEAVRKMDNYNKSPFVMVTTMDDIQDILDASEKGSDGYIVKPYTKEDVSGALSFGYQKRQS